MTLLSIFGLTLLALTEGIAYESSESQDVIFKLLKSVYQPKRSPVNEKFNSDEVGEPLILTKYIEEGKLKEAREASRVNSELMNGIESYTGFLTVNKKYNGNLFFWYFPVQNKPVDTTPWIIWLQGGPGVSSLYGLFTENGPIRVTDDGKLEKRKHSWGRNHSLLYIDNPVGAGFSFTDDERGYATNQSTIGEGLYTALQQFLTVFSELRKAPLIISGESYAGKHIPSLGIQIHRRPEQDPAINLRGLAIGNGFIDPISLQRYSYFVREVGLLDDHEADLMREDELRVMQAMSEGNTTAANNFWIQVTARISKIPTKYNYLSDEGDNLDGPYEHFVTSVEVRKAIHVGNKNFTALNYHVFRLLDEDIMNSAKPWLEELIANDKVMCYNGHLDFMVAYHPSVHTYLSLKFPGSEKMNATVRCPWYSGGSKSRRLAGYIKTVGNFSDVMVRGAGHMVPADQPEAALHMITSFAEVATGKTNWITDGCTETTAPLSALWMT